MLASLPPPHGGDIGSDATPARESNADPSYDQGADTEPAADFEVFDPVAELDAALADLLPYQLDESPPSSHEDCPPMGWEGAPPRVSAEMKMALERRGVGAKPAHKMSLVVADAARGGGGGVGGQDAATEEHKAE